MKQNLLPPAVAITYAVEYSEEVFDAITIFKNSDRLWGVLKETAAGEYELLVEPVYHTISFNPVWNYLQAVVFTEGYWQADGCNYYFYDVNGQVKASVSGVSRARIDETGRLLVLKNDHMGLMDASGETIIKFSYVSLFNLQGDIYKAQKGNGYGIIDTNENVLLNFKYKYIFTNVANDRVIVQDLNDRYFSFHFPTGELHALPYNNILPATELGLHKAILQSQETEFDYGDNGMSEYTGSWGIIYADGTPKIPAEYAFVDWLTNPNYFKVATGKFTFHFNGHSDTLIAEGVKWGVVDANNKIVVPLEYDWVQEEEDTLWVVNKGGAVFFNEESARWEVQGGDNEIIAYNS